MSVTIHIPLQQLKAPERASVWVKRDDMIDPYISGNKWRKLKYILEGALASGRRHLVTFGGAYSNHLVAVAAACARNGLRSTAFVRGEMAENEMLLLCRLYGMELRFTDRLAYKDKRGLFERHFGGDAEACFVDEGGAGTPAVLGCAELVTELPPDTRHLFCAAGTGTTAAGLLKGIRETGMDTLLHVVPVLKGGEFIRAEIARYTDGLDRLVLHTAYHFGGYARTSPELTQFIGRFAAAEGILTDPVYTGKLFFALEDLLSQGRFAADEKIVVVHTGGLLGIWGMKEKFSVL